MSTPLLWRIYCMEDEWPGLWHLWLKHQCATVSYPPEDGYSNTEGTKTKRKRDWIQACNAMGEIQPGHKIIAALPGRRVGRIGEVFRNETAKDKWQNLIPGDRENPKGHMGRRILVRWDLEHGPDDLDMVVQLPVGFRLGRGTVNQVHSVNLTQLQKEMSNQTNWVGLVGRFGYEEALSDYIALYPHRLEDGLQPYPNEKVRERVFKDKSRLDVLLLDKDERPVIAECKQDPPSLENIRQLVRYMRRLKEVTHRPPRGILVHGGGLRVDRRAWIEAATHNIRIFQYRLDVTFAPSSR